MVFQFCIILCGLPASGKSTLAKQLENIASESDLFDSLKTVDIDLMRKHYYQETGGLEEFKPELEGAFRESKVGEIERLLGSGASVIDDDLNYFRSMRRETVEACVKHLTHYAIIHLETPRDICLAWNEKRPDPVPEEVIVRVQEKFDVPGSRTYLWDKPYSSINPRLENIEDAAKDIISRIIDQIPVIEENKVLLEGYFRELDDVEKLGEFNLANLEHSSIISRFKKKVKKTKKGKSSISQQFDIAARKLINEFVRKNGSILKRELDTANRIKKDGLKEIKKNPTQSPEYLEKLKKYLNSLNTSP